MGRQPDGDTSSLVAASESELDDSFLKELVHESPLPIPMPVPGERLGGQDGTRYEILELAGRGGMGRVFRALDHELRRTVALKFLLSVRDLSEPRVATLVREEAQAIARLDHENVVRIHDVALWHTGFRQGNGALPFKLPFLVMEYLEGESLQALLRRGRLELRRALALMIDVAAGLAHAHERHIIHLDIKPGNVFITASGRAKLLDFGLSQLLSGTSASLESGGAGTPPYMSPQQWRREPPSARDDTWACGLILFEMLTGEHPLPLVSPHELRVRVTSPEPMPSLRAHHPELPAEVERFVASTLDKEPANRPADGSELLKRLCELQERLALQPLRPQASAERRQVTLVACRLALVPGARMLNPEDFSELELLFHRACTRIIQQHGGTITTAVGAEVLASFGYPLVQEEDSEHAVRAALQQTRQLARELACAWCPGLSMRVGIHTDVVTLAAVMSEFQGMTPAMQGEAPRLASWLATQAEPDTVLLSDQTHALVRGRFQTRALGPRTFEGLSGAQPIGVHQVLHERGNVTRFDRAFVMGPLTPLVGRERELRRLAQLREEATREHGTFILLRGEAGIGKSRLVQELHDREPPSTSTWVRSQCWPQFKSSAFYPLIDWLRRFLDFSPQDGPPEKLRKLEDQLGASGLSAEHLLPLASLLSLPLPREAPFLLLPPERQRERGVQALSALLQQLAGQRPLVFVMEDVHWADPSTLHFLGFLLEHLDGLRLCVLLTSRPELTQAWAERPGFHELRLARLPPEATVALVQQAARGRALQTRTVEQLVARTDGIPLFVEELTRMVVEQQGRGETSPEDDLPPIPATLHESLQVRLAQLPPRTKALAQLAALLGREFDHDVLRAISFLGENELQRELRRLEQAGLLFEQGWPPHLVYAFKHTLVQDAAYQSLPRSTRQHYHTRIFHVLREQFPAMPEEHPELLAHHATRAGLTVQAVDLWQRAGQRTAAKSALFEAGIHFSRALDQLALLPASRERDEREIALRVELGQALVSTKGFAAREVEEVYTRAYSLCERYGDLPLSVLWGLWVVAVVRGDGEAADRLSVHFYRLLETHEDPATRMVAHVGLGSWIFWKGAYDTALRHCILAQQQLARDRSLMTSARIRGGGSQSDIVEQVLNSYLYKALSESILGDIDRARRSYHEALAVAEEMQHPYALAHTLTFCASIERIACEPELARDLANRVISVSAGNGFVFTLAIGYCVLGWATAQLGDIPAGIATLQQGLALIQAIGAQLIYPTCLVLLLRTYLLSGQYAEGLAATREGLKMLDGLLARQALPDLLWLQGEFLLRQGETEAARDSLERSLVKARDFGAAISEVCAAMSLARLLRQSARTEEASALLSEACGRFPEGVDLRDYKAARALLAELSAQEPAPGTSPG
ncbi:protein kinase [Vitiosangium sp. GDMCC 1.1324]|uniref:protein kinase domain-containing protein n=1 Tax=Vitiosangium sp. (strain GDMCC 1.1324) TaxID=2138576 RepID=UPI00130DE741|nr:protein kinase [Vitiosangium sp. GDMCC 1.1324]